ncbi:MAG TPA: ABC transporter permease [Gaiellaceae bacterium]|nr:ABC transporter permease [Gaiellaceae bacterium]
MTRFILRRLLHMVPVLFGVTVVVFVTIKLIPGSPIAGLLGPGSTPATRAELINRLGLNKPIPIQYFDWLRSTLEGNFGTSISFQSSAGTLVFNAFRNTMILAGAALILALVGGFVLGAIGALWPKGMAGRVTSAISTFSLAIPQYSAGLLLIVLFSVDHTWLPSGGMHSVTGSTGFADLLRHLVLPALAAGLAPIGVVARMFRAALLDVMGQEFVQSMRARGLRRTTIIRHAIHNTLPALLTITGLQIGYLLSGVVFIETIFSWPGLGQLVYGAISARDLPLIQAGVLISAVAVVLVNVIVDVAHGFIDPRVRQ